MQSESHPRYGPTILLIIAALLIAAVSMLFAWYEVEVDVINYDVSGYHMNTYETHYYLYGQDQGSFSDILDAEVAMILVWFFLGWVTCELFIYSRAQAALVVCLITVFVAISAVLNLVVWTYSGGLPDYWDIKTFYGSWSDETGRQEWGPGLGWSIIVLACALNIAAMSLAAREYNRTRRSISQQPAPQKLPVEGD